MLLPEATMCSMLETRSRRRLHSAVSAERSFWDLASCCSSVRTFCLHVHARVVLLPFDLGTLELRLRPVIHFVAEPNLQISVALHEFLTVAARPERVSVWRPGTGSPRSRGATSVRL